MPWRGRRNNRAVADGVNEAILMPLLTLGQAAGAKVRLIVWCKVCQHRFEPDTAELAEQHGAATTVISWATRLRCSQCGARDADYVVSGTKR